MSSRVDENPIISIIVPCYNEEDVIEIFLQTIEPILKKVDRSYEIIFINDGSIDNTFNVMLDMKSKYKGVRVLNLSRNFGKESALTAGLERAKGEVASY